MNHLTLLFCSLFSVLANPSFQGEEPIGVLVENTSFWIGLPDDSNSIAFLKIPEGKEVKILGEHEDYFEVQYRHLEGYVAKSSVKLLPSSSEGQPAEEEPIVEAAREAEPKAEAASPKLRTKGAEKNGPATTETTSKAPAPEKSDVYRVTKETSLRTGPHHTHDVRLRLPVGGEVKLLEKTDIWWWKVEYEGKQGWAKKALLEQ